MEYTLEFKAVPYIAKQPHLLYNKQYQTLGVHMCTDCNGKVIKPALVNVLKQLYNTKCEYFDYPEYGGLDQSVSFKLSSGFVDSVQDNIQNMSEYETFEAWAKSFDVRYF